MVDACACRSKPAAPAPGETTRAATGNNNNNNNNNTKSGQNKKRARQPRFAFMTKSDVDHLEDGYRWRKYGQKAVKNSPFPRYPARLPCLLYTILIVHDNGIYTVHVIVYVNYLIGIARKMQLGVLRPTVPSLYLSTPVHYGYLYFNKKTRIAVIGAKNS